MSTEGLLWSHVGSTKAQNVVETMQTFGRSAPTSSLNCLNELSMHRYSQQTSVVPGISYPGDRVREGCL